VNFFGYKLSMVFKPPNIKLLDFRKLTKALYGKRIFGKGPFSFRAIYQSAFLSLY
jgi:hypothetical protein